jgi:GTP-dependent phosphoenolpyruvate carboxykinase
LELAPGVLDELLEVDDGAVRAELRQIRDYLAQFGERLPAEFGDQLARRARQAMGENARGRTRHRSGQIA